MGPAIVFRAGTSRGYAVATWAVAAVVLVALLVEDGATALLSFGALPVFLAVIGWAAFWRPLVRVERDGVRVVNVLSTTWLPWAAVTGTRTRWGLEITTHHGKVGAWALPSRSALGRWTRTHREEPVVSSLRRLDADETGGSDPTVAAGLIEEHRTGHVLAADDAPRPERRLDVVPAGLLLASTGLAIVTLLL